MLSVDDADVAARAAVGSARDLDAAVRKQIKATIGATIVDAARRAAGSAAHTPLARRVAATARASWYKDVPGVAFGGTRTVARSGVKGRAVAHGVEYGSDGQRRATFRTHSPRGHAYSVTRATSRQFRPRHEGGAFVAGAAEQIAPDVVDTWAALVVDAYVEMVS